MTNKTRRRVFLSIFVLALTLPAETILLKALQAPNDTVAVQQWAASLDGAQLDDASANIQKYPFQYRKEIMRQLSLDRRAAVWRNHIQGYISQHPELDANALNALKAAESAAVPEGMTEMAPASVRLSMNAAADQVQSLLGVDTAKYLLYYLGPKDVQSASAEPLMMKLASYVRHQFALLARSEGCDCNFNFGCDSGDMRCSDQIYCNQDNSWPMCGWFWDQVCNGLCSGGY